MLREPAFFICALGFACITSFIALQSLTLASLPAFANGPSWIVSFMRAIEALTYAGVALLSSRIGRLNDHRAAIYGAAVACALLAVFEFVVTAGETAPLPLPVHLVICAVRSIAPALLWLAWIELFASMDTRHVLAYYLAASVISALVTIAATPLPKSAIVAVCIALPLCSVGLLKRAQTLVAASTFAHGEQPASAWSFPWVPVLLMAIFTFANIFARDLLPANDRGFATIGVLACLIALVLVLATGKQGGQRDDMRARFNVWDLCGAAVPLTLAGLFGTLMQTPALGIAATALTHGGDALFAVFLGVVLCNVSFRYGVNALLLFGFAEAAGSLAGIGAGFASDALRGSQGDALTLVAALAAVALVTCFVVLARDQKREATWGLPQDAAAQLTTPATNTHEHDLLAACASIAYDFGLTRREEQVLTLLAQGKTAAQIEDELVVSNSTVKTHTHAVYQKLGIHERSQVAAFVQERIDNNSNNE